MESKTKQLAKNSLYMYIRMIVMTIVTLYTSRIVLLALGLSDFGIYNVVGGVVAMFSFISASMQTATQRFLSFELGRKDEKGFNSVFCSSTVIYIAICIIFLILAETVGLWFVYNNLNIGTSDIGRVVYIYQLSIATSILLFLRIPYVAGLISQEKMSFFAFNSILEAVLKLALVFCLLKIDSDKLVLYGWLIFLVTFIVNITYIVWCKWKFTDLYKFSFAFSKETLLKITTFSGWRILGAFSQIVDKQGTSVLINLVWSPLINAALGISYQVNAAVYSLLAGFQQAFTPILTKTYAEGNQDNELFKLIKTTSLISFALITVISLPLIVNIDVVLDIWLVDVAKYTGIFCALLLLNIVIDSFSAPLYTVILSTGKIAYYQIWISFITIAGFCGTVIVAYAFDNPKVVLLPKIIATSILLLYRLYLTHQIIGISYKQYIFNILLKPLFMFTVSWMVLYFISAFVSNFASLVLSIIFAITVYPLMFYKYLLDASAQLAIGNMIKIKLHLNGK